MNHSIEVGDVFVEVWGYDQTNVDCYKVKVTTPSSVGLVQCGHKSVETQMTGDYVVPDPAHEIPWPRQTAFDPETGEWTETDSYAGARGGKVRPDGTLLKRVLTSKYDGKSYLKMSSYSIATLWDGERRYWETNPMFGH